MMAMKSEAVSYAMHLLHVYISYPVFYRSSLAEQKLLLQTLVQAKGSLATK